MIHSMILPASSVVQCETVSGTVFGAGSRFEVPTGSEGTRRSLSHAHRSDGTDGTSWRIEWLPCLPGTTHWSFSLYSFGISIGVVNAELGAEYMACDIALVLAAVPFRGIEEIAAQTEITVLGKISGDGCGPATVDGDDDACSDRRRRCAIAPSNQARCCRGYCAAILDQLFPRRRSLVFSVRHRIRVLRKLRGSRWPGAAVQNMVRKVRLSLDAVSGRGLLAMPCL